MKNMRWSVGGFFNNSPKWVHLVSVLLIGWGTYGSMINDFINAAPIDVPVFKATLIEWMNWLCPALGFAMQFIHTNSDSVPPVTTN